MTFVPVSNYNAEFLKESTLILPTVSIGNVPQLVSDLLIHTFKLERIGFLDTDTVVPVSGVREDSAYGVTVPLEVFQSKDKQWACIQQRSPTLKGKRQEFISEMTQFTSQFKAVVIVTTMDASRRLDCQINGPPFRVVGQSEFVDKSVSLGVPVLEEMKFEDEDDKLRLPGSGLTPYLYETLHGLIPTTVLVMFVLEGDNVQDSIEYANYINTVLSIQTDIKGGWTPPKSWEYLFGTPFNADLYQ